MYILKYVFLILFFNFFLSLEVPALFAQTWDFRQCAKYALEHSLKIKEYKYIIEKQEIVYRSAFADMLPQIGGGTNYSTNHGKTIDPNTNLIIEQEFSSNSYNLNGSIQLFNGFRTHHLIKFEKYNLLVAEKEYEKQQNDLVYRIMEVYTKQMLHEGLTDIQQQQCDKSEKEVERIKEMINAGRLPGSAHYEAMAQMEADRFTLIKYKNMASQSLLELKTLMHYPADSVLVLQEIVSVAPNLPITSVDSVYNLAKRILPEIQKLEKQLQSASKQVQLTRAQMYPSVSFSSGNTTGYYETFTDASGQTISFRDQLDRNRRFNYGISLHVPIFYGMERVNRVKLAKVGAQQMENELENRLSELQYEISGALLSLRASSAEYQSALAKGHSREVAFQKSGMQWDKGLISIMDYYESRNNLAVAQGEILRTRLQLFLNQHTIRFYLTASFF